MGFRDGHARIGLVVALIMLLGACAPEAEQVPVTGAPTTTEPAAEVTTTEPGQATTIAPAGEAVTLEFWDFEQSQADILAAQEAALEEFQAANPNIRVNVTVFPYPVYRDRMLTAVQGGSPPDLATLDQIWMAEFAEAGAIVPVDDLLADSELSSELFFQGAWDSNVYQDQTWGIPMSNDVWEEMYYNRSMLEEAGLDPDQPPATWEELFAACQELTQAPERYGIGLIGAKGEFLTVSIDSFIFTNGGQIVDESGTASALDSPEVIEALEAYAGLAECAPEGTANRDEAAAVNAFTSQQVAIGLLGSWQQDTFNAQAPDMDWDVAMVPSPEGKTFHGALGGWNLAIFEASENKEAAWTYIEFLTQKDVQKAVNSLIPARLDAAEEFLQENRKGPEIIFETIQNGFPRPLSPVYPQISEVQQNMMQEIWAGTPVEEAVARASDEIDQILSQ